MSDNGRPELEVDLDGRTYRMRFDEFTGEDELAIHREIGQTIHEVLNNLTLFGLAALIWRHRVRQGESVEYAEVNRELSYADLETVRTEEEEFEEGGPPEV